MTIVLNDPSLWPIISYSQETSYFEVICLTAVVYDWALTFGQEFELVWRQRWSLMTFLYLSVRYIGIPYSVITMLVVLTSISFTDAGCTILYFVESWISIIVNAMLGVMIIARLYAMITSVVIAAILIQYISGEEYVFSGVHMCTYAFQGDAVFLIGISWILVTPWETLALCLAVWAAVKHFRELQQPSTRWTVGDCFTILIKTHVFYFASFVTVSTFQLSNDFSLKLENSNSVAEEIFLGILGLARGVQMFILGPRLILGVREYHANLVANSDEGTGIASIIFQERVHISTGDGV